MSSFNQFHAKVTLKSDKNVKYASINNLVGLSPSKKGLSPKKTTQTTYKNPLPIEEIEEIKEDPHD